MFAKTSIEEETKKTEIKMCTFLAEHNLPFRVMDHLSELLEKCFHDSEIAKNFSCKRTKAAALTYNVLKPQVEKEMHAELASCVNIRSRPVFSIVIDESTDVTSTKVLAVVIKYCSEKKQCLQVKTKFLALMDLEGESAQNLFDALSQSLTNANLDIKHCIGFGADTTNVMFGNEGGVIAKIREVNPHCVFVKCVCHSIALAVSHASKNTLPRSLNQIVKEVYGYFAHSSKRQREFQEFHFFFNSENHKILQHYDIRWLSLHACINRIIEQWDPLKFYFRGQYLEDKNISAEFLSQNFENDMTKLYFYALDYILPIPNKMNVIFQGEYSTVQRVYRDSADMLILLLSCYMKTAYLKNTHTSELDPKSSVNFLPLSEIYVGLKVSQLIESLSQDPRQKADLTKFLQRIQSFLIQLCVELKSRLPLSELFEHIQFLDPQHIVYKDFRSLNKILSKFSNLVNETEIQTIDSEYRQLKLDKEVANLLELGGTSQNEPINTEKFWGHVSKITNADGTKKYLHIVDFAKAMLVLPMSNTACERLFSQMNNIKTDMRNKFKNEHVAAILHVKQAVKEQDGCVNFKPTKEMIKNAQNSAILYKNIVNDETE